MTKISRSAYAIGSVIVVGGCTVHSLAVSIAKGSLGAAGWLGSLHAGLRELVALGHLAWRVFPRAYGDGPGVRPKRYDDADEFEKYWVACFGHKKSEEDFWTRDYGGLRDVAEPTIELNAAGSLGPALDAYEGTEDHPHPAT